MIIRFLIPLLFLSLVSCKKNNNPDESRSGATRDTVTINDSIIRERNFQLRRDIGTQWTYDTYSDSNQAMYEHFVLDLKNEGDSVKGRYCATADNGKILDCNNSTEYNIRGFIANGKITAEFYSFLGSKDKKGIAELQLINSSQLEWKIIKAPQSPFYFPKNLQLAGNYTSKGCGYPGRKTGK
ncbi:hypothetical protein [Chryseobacterium vrystaatense]|uniref:Uncharacterized protein n=1 Tax=Chryseobacterium vrystaatense TaxID=307480 RepID=A0A1M5NSJ2_9FLAO|nr:hypothetical protein [Chryseobacterium vrystaatense]SHG92564.1 hypothetical protein SAMN02787073_5072 [Chryseobacterium vrystaatense]